jgi:type I restriction enzyme S subunit
MMANEWRAGKLGELVAFKTGKLDSNAAVPDGDYPFFTCSQETLRTNTYSFDTECVLLAGNNANGIYPLKYFHGKFDAYQRTYVVKPRDTEVLTTKFLYYALRPKLSELRSFSTGAATKFLTLTILNETEIQVPPLPVQRRIAGILSAYDELTENSQRRIRLLEAMARALYREWFVHFRFPGHEKLPRVASPLGDIPQGWEISPLSSLVDFAKGRKPAETRPESLPGDVKLLLIDSLHGGEAVFASPAKLVLAETRDTIMVMDGASSCEVTIGSSGAVGSTLGRFRTTRPGVFSPHALYRFLEAKADEFKSKNIGAAIPHANKDYILTQPVALPPKATASGFHAQLEPIQCTIETLKLQIQNLRRTRDLLLPRLLSGQVNLKTH